MINHFNFMAYRNSAMSNFDLIGHYGSLKDRRLQEEATNPYMGPFYCIDTHMIPKNNTKRHHLW